MYQICTFLGLYFKSNKYLSKYNQYTCMKYNVLIMHLHCFMFIFIALWIRYDTEFVHSARALHVGFPFGKYLLCINSTTIQLITVWLQLLLLFFFVGQLKFFKRVEKAKSRGIDYFRILFSRIIISIYIISDIQTFFEDDIKDLKRIEIAYVYQDIGFLHKQQSHQVQI